MRHLLLVLGVLALALACQAAFSIDAFTTTAKVPVGREASFSLALVNESKIPLGPGRLTVESLVPGDANVDFNGVDFNVVQPGGRLDAALIRFRANRLTNDGRLFFRVTISYKEKTQLVRQTADVFVGIEDTTAFDARRDKAVEVSAELVRLQSEIVPMEKSLDEAAKADASFAWLVDELGRAYARIGDCREKLAAEFATDDDVAACESDRATIRRLWLLVQDRFCSSSASCSFNRACQSGVCVDLVCLEGETLRDHACATAGAVQDDDFSADAQSPVSGVSSTGFFSLGLPEVPWPLVGLAAAIVLGVLLIWKNRPERPNKPAMNDLRYV